jgi:hypothetical protein
MLENDNDRSIADILQSSMIGLRDSDIDIYQKIIELANEGFFEKHQTAGKLKSLADTLIAIHAGGETGNEGK